MSRLIPSRRLALVLTASALIMVGSPQVPVNAACEPVYGPNGSQDPALGFSPACTGLEDRDAATLYGPNGSQDPALGFAPNAPTETQIASIHTCTIRGVTDIDAICATGNRDASQPWQGDPVSANRTSPHDQAY